MPTAPAGSAVPDPGGEPPQKGSPLWIIVGSLFGFCSVAAAIAQDTGLSERFARAHPALPALPILAFLAIPAGYLAIRVGSAAGRHVMNAARRNQTAAACFVVLSAGLAVAALAQADSSPTSPARLTRPVSYYDIPGDASVLDEHVTLPVGKNVVAGGTTQVKIFRLHNIGTVDWAARWLCRDDPAMNTRSNLRTADCVPIPDTPAGQTVEVPVEVKVANRDGVLVAAFKMSDGGGNAWYYRDATPVYIRLDVRKR